jgi:hypothetical protein
MRSIDHPTGEKACREHGGLVVLGLPAVSPSWADNHLFYIK